MLLLLNCLGNVSVKLTNQQAVKIGKTGTKKLRILNLKNVRIFCNSCTVDVCCFVSKPDHCNSLLWLNNEIETERDL